MGHWVLYVLPLGRLSCHSVLSMDTDLALVGCYDASFFLNTKRQRPGLILWIQSASLKSSDSESWPHPGITQGAWNVTGAWDPPPDVMAKRVPGAAGRWHLKNLCGGCLSGSAG